MTSLNFKVMFSSKPFGVKLNLLHCVLPGRSLNVASVYGGCVGGGPCLLLGIESLEITSLQKLTPNFPKLSAPLFLHSHVT